MPTIKARSFPGLRQALALTALLAVALPSMAAPMPEEQSPAWILRKQVDNIEIYTAPRAGSGFEAFKAVAILKAPIENVMAVMINPESCEQWVHNCSESYAVGQQDFHDRYAYSVNDMPWPVTDRDYVLRIRTRGEAGSGEIVMDMNATPDIRAQYSSRVRVDHSNTHYRLIPEGEQTRMIWIQHTDPNGALPGWLVNSLIVDIPLKSIQALEALAQQEQYRGYRLDWANDGNLKAVTRSQP
ncbi:lipid-binding protein [Marinobacter fuscus]|uniref:Lipid-binding protein n=1 Tax=Marinobacter fuscus TaxID=2109942 RepID=A0A2T1KKS1_9GAMM|nr:START domain-containing protein [Marinobacter fuscus]PSF10618.1 lipid-binding protein [Marinobacter fuscus]